MNHYLLNARSVTHAQQLMHVLERSGVTARIRRTGSGLSKGGCGYTLQIPERQFQRAADALRESMIRPVRVFRVVNGTAQEVVL